MKDANPKYACYCSKVTEEQVVDAVLKHGAKTAQEVNDITGALKNFNRFQVCYRQGRLSGQGSDVPARTGQVFLSPETAGRQDSSVATLSIDMYEKISSISSTATGVYLILFLCGIDLPPHSCHDFIMFNQLFTFSNLLFCNQ
nr:(2Fe-2S)-binding protein [Thermincola potens]